MASVTFSTSIGGDGSTVTDDSNPNTGLANGGHRTRFVPALAQMVAVAATLTSRFINSSDTSTSSVTIGTGSKSLTTAKVYIWAIGQWVLISSTASPTNYMYGQVTAYNSSTGALTVNVTSSNGSGTFTAWTVAVTVSGGSLLTVVSKDSSTGAASLPAGTTAQRPSVPIPGSTRLNTDTGKYEGYNGTTWIGIGGGATGGGSDAVFVENDQTVTTNYTISTNKNASSVGPITIANGVTVTIPSGSTWAII